MSSSSSNSTAPPPDSNSDSGSGSSPPPPSDSDSGSGSGSSPSPPSLPPPPPPPQSSKGSPPSPPTSKNNNKSPSPPPPPSKSSHNSPSSGSSSGLSDQQQKILIGGCVVAGLVIVALIIICLTCCRRKKKKNMHGYYGEYHHGGNGQFYDGTQQANWHNTPSRTEHGMKLSSQQGGGWNGPPSPFPQPPTYNSDISSNYSGPRRPPLPPPSPNAVLGFNQSTFTYDDLAVATGGFSQDMLLGQGGFGYVHKGVLPNGKEIAVKSLKSGSGQGEREFQAEVDIISRVHHRHLVSLVGYCIAGSQRMLVYEFVPNKTLEYHLHGKDLPVMDWPTRLRIALGSAKGLAYLHEDCHPKIIHRDIKSANILLDFKFEAMVADFGLAKLSSDTNTHVSTRVMGTFGYLAPEYASSGKLTEKSDVFSFGVMLLELITGNRPVDPKGVEDSMVEWARPLLTRAMEEGVYHELVDLRLDNNFNPQEMQRMIACASASIRHSAKRRPKMSQVVRVLEGDVVLDDLNELQRTGTSSLFGGSNGSSDLDTPNYDTAMYNTDMKRFRQVALSSQEFGSSEHSSGNSPKPNF